VPEIEIEELEVERWKDVLFDEQVEPRSDDYIHISDMLICMRQAPLQEEFYPVWDLVTLLRFAFGRAFEEYVGKKFYPEHERETEVIVDGIGGHIDLGAEENLDGGYVDLDVECKLTWGRIPHKDDEEGLRGLLKSKFYWLEQMMSYAHMRGMRDSMRLAVLSLYPQPNYEIYKVDFEPHELERMWGSLVQRRDNILKHRGEGTLPMRTIHTWACKGCPVNGPCYS
jgi:hypothetical protein